MEIPPDPGSYIIVGRLAKEVCLTTGLFKGYLLARGYYLYTGSAFGPGGLLARTTGHLNPETKKFWHSDHIKAHMNIDEIWYSLGGKYQECQFIKVLAGMKNSSFPIHKFGSSDCTHGCPAHLVMYAPETDLDSVFALLVKHISSMQRISLT